MISKTDSNIEIQTKCLGAYLIVAKAVLCTDLHFLIRSQLEYGWDQAYADSGHVHIGVCVEKHLCQ